MKEKSILLVEDNVKLANYLKQSLQEIGYDVSIEKRDDRAIDLKISRLRKALDWADPIEQLTDRDVLELFLALKEPFVFKGHKDLLESILANKALLQRAIVSCGKVLIGGPNNNVIDLLSKNIVLIKKACQPCTLVQNFYNYRKDPLNLIKNIRLWC